MHGNIAATFLQYSYNEVCCMGSEVVETACNKYRDFQQVIC